MGGRAVKNPWFRLYSEFASDPKIQAMSETFQRRFVMLLCLKCSGDLGKLSPEEIAVSLRISNDELEETKSCFVKKGFIDENWEVLNWDKRQFLSDDVTKRVREHRDRLRVSGKNETFQKRYRNGNETPPDTDTDTDTDTEKKKKHSSKLNGSKCPHEEILSLYHETLPELPRIREWTPQRQALLRARWTEDKERQNVAWWGEFFRNVAGSDFLCGKVSEFKADLEWLIRPKNFPKVLEGRYTNGVRQKSRYFQ